ncbi:MAG: aminopeptidase P family protein [Clostridia bacterium]|nr:aminopeptidase P family protein [Clostridia bacterium]
MIPNRLAALRAEMAARGITCYIIPTADFHESEYVGEYFKARVYMTGFTGSAGTLVVTPDHAGLWTDARYFLQAERQLEGSTVTLYKMGEEGVPTLNEFLKNTLTAGGKLGFDGRVVSYTFGKTLKELCAAVGCGLHIHEDLVDLIWPDRPPMSAKPVRILPMELSGKSAIDKMAQVRAVMAEKGADLHLLTSLDDIAWLLNVRGGDVKSVPVVLSYLALDHTSCRWFLNPALVTDELSAYLSEIGVTPLPYDSFYDYAREASPGKTVLLNGNKANLRLSEALSEGTIVDAPNPSEVMKATKNPVEQENARIAHKKDAIAVTKFMYWLKTNIGKIEITEISAAEKLLSLRKEQEGFLEPSFGTICGYGPHGAIMHYGATPETNLTLSPEGFLLVDSGGHYNEGSTDITRTFALGPISEAMRHNFTIVLRSNLNLAAAKFLYGCTGFNLDILARGPFWDEGIDFKHGTGHGVGNLLSVHEGPNGFRWKQSPGRNEGSVLEEGMITSDEPGYYEDGAYGIRLENEILCRKGEKTSYGQFMYFENLTYVPLDLDAIDPDMLTTVDKARLNAFHKQVFETISPYLNPEETEFLAHYTRAI